MPTHLPTYVPVTLFLLLVYSGVEDIELSVGFLMSRGIDYTASNLVIVSVYRTVNIIIKQFVPR